MEVQIEWPVARIFVGYSSDVATHVTDDAANTDNLAITDTNVNSQYDNGKPMHSADTAEIK